MNMKCKLLFFLTFLMFPAFSYAQHETHLKDSAPLNLVERDHFRVFLLIEMMEIHNQLGLICGCHDEMLDYPGTLQNQLDRVYAYASEQTDLLVEEAVMAFPERVDTGVVEAYLEARTAGYGSIEEMYVDVKRVLGEGIDKETEAVYLLLRRNELYGLSGRTPSLKALVADIAKLKEPIRVEQLWALLKERRNIWLSGILDSSIDQYSLELFKYSLSHR